MALIEVKVPQLSESVAEATLLQWHKRAGEAVERDQNLIDIETDKVVLELPAPEAGVIAQILKADGATVVAGEVIAVIDTEAKAAAATAPAPAAAAPIVAPGTGAAPAPAGSKGDVAMPAAAKMLAEAGLSTAQVSGTGRDGRVTKGDVIAAIAVGTRPAAPAPALTPGPAIPTGATFAMLPAVPAPIDPAKLIEGRPEQRVPMSRLRQRVAERLLFGGWFSPGE